MTERVLTHGITRLQRANGVYPLNPPPLQANDSGNQGGGGDPAPPPPRQDQSSPLQGTRAGVARLTNVALHQG